MISFIVPAHNEQACLPRTLQAIHEAAHVAGQPYEIIVVDDASTDSTAEIARQNNARVVSVNHRQIAATRNSGGRAAQGERLFFVDADTVINPQVVASALRKMDKGAAGGGALARFERPVPLYAILLLWWLNLFMRLLGMTGGALHVLHARRVLRGGRLQRATFRRRGCRLFVGVETCRPVRRVVEKGTHLRTPSAAEWADSEWLLPCFGWPSFPNC